MQKWSEGGFLSRIREQNARKLSKAGSFGAAQLEAGNNYLQQERKSLQLTWEFEELVTVPNCRGKLITTIVVGKYTLSPEFLARHWTITIWLARARVHWCFSTTLQEGPARIRWCNNHVVRTLLVVAGDCNNWCFRLLKFIVCKWFQEKKGCNSFASLRLKFSFSMNSNLSGKMFSVLWITNSKCHV